MTDRPPAASIRTEVMVPLRFADGYTTVARVLTFDGLVDGREHLALGLGDRVATLRIAIPGQEPHEVALVAAADVPRANAWQRLRNGVVGLFR